MISVFLQISFSLSFPSLSCFKTACAASPIEYSYANFDIVIVEVEVDALLFRTIASNNLMFSCSSFPQPRLFTLLCFLNFFLDICCFLKGSHPFFLNFFSFIFSCSGLSNKLEATEVAFPLLSGVQFDFCSQKLCFEILNCRVCIPCFPFFLKN